MQLTFGGPQIGQLPATNKNWWEPAANQTSNMMWSLVTAKMAHKMRMEEEDRRLEKEKIKLDAAKEEARLKAKSEGMQKGLKYGEPEGEYDPYLKTTVSPSTLSAQPLVVDGKPIGYAVRQGADLKLMANPKDSDDKGPAAIQQFEMVRYGKAVPELRGTPQYQADYLTHIKETKEQNPMLDWTSRQFEMQRQKEGSALRTEFNTLPEVKNYADTRSKFEIAREAYKESQKNGSKVATDQALITMFNKITDPQSVVRESEYARTASDLSLLNRLKGKYDKWVSGGAGLTDEDRKAILDMSEKFHKVSEKKYKSREKEYRGYFTNIGFNPDKYLNPYGAQDEAAPPKAASTEKPAAAPAKKEVRRGKEKGTGKTVIQYDDGTVGYAD